MQDTNVQNLIINKLTKAQYESIANPSNTELYLIPDDSSGGTSRNIGEIVASTIPLTDAGLHLLDGALIDGSGIYAAFVDYIADLYGDGTDIPSYFTDETSWQQSVTYYGVCGKFVYDSVNNTVRLPKRTSEHGYLIESGSSGNAKYRVYSDGWCEQQGTSKGTNANVTTSFIKPFIDTNYVLLAQNHENVTSAWSNRFGYNKTTTGFTWLANSNVTHDWYACGYIDISNYQKSPIYEYIVIATTTKTAIQVDIDEIATDLNGKADIDLTNTTDSAKVMMSGMGMPSDKYIDLTLGANGSTYTAPANGYYVFRSDNRASATTAYYLYMYGSISVGTVVQTSTHGGSVDTDMLAYLPVKKGGIISIYHNMPAVGSAEIRVFRFIYAQGAESEA